VRRAIFALLDVDQRARPHGKRLCDDATVGGISLISDNQLQQDVPDELEFEPRVKAAHIGVVAKAGVVTLTGFVTSYSEKFAAEAAVRREASSSKARCMTGSSAT
jgi:hypothetical protein